MGFDLAGITSAEAFVDKEEAIVQRIREGLMDGLPWFYETRASRGCHPREVLPSARSIISLAISYHTPEPATAQDGKLRGRVSRYAWNTDYHKVIDKKLKAFIQRLREVGCGEARFYVDTGPVPDRAVAHRAGIGWYGKNTNILTDGFGSQVFLAEVLTDLDLEPDAPSKKGCGRCSKCIPSCPTAAIVSPYVLDNRRCIAYLTIEHCGAIPRDLRPLMGTWVFGCDICQDVCPVNRKAFSATESSFSFTALGQSHPDLLAILEMSEADFLERFGKTPVKRAKLLGLKRNVCVALGNLGDRVAIPELIVALRHGEPLLRGHAAWALGRIGGEGALSALLEASSSEQDPYVKEEISTALAGCSATLHNETR